MPSGITLTEVDPATIPTPDAGKDTIFMDATASPPAPAYKDSSGNVLSLQGDTGPVGPAGPTGSITTNPNGALDGDGSGGSPLGVRVDNVTIGINASNEIESLVASGGTVTHTAGALTAGKLVLGNGAADITVSAVTADLAGSAAGTPTSVAVRNGLTLAGGNLDVNVDNETIGLDSNDKLQVIAHYVTQDSVRRGLTYSGGYLDVNVDNETIGIDSHDKLQVIQPYLVGQNGRLPIGSLSQNYLLYQEQQAQNTQGGTFTSGAWRTRTLNTEVSDLGGFGTLASNQITLASGTYIVSAMAPAFGTDVNQLRLQNVSDGVTLVVGMANEARTATVIEGSPALLRGVFSIAAGRAIELQHQAQTTRATDGFGVACNFTTEVYAVLELWKIA